MPKTSSLADQAYRALRTATTQGDRRREPVEGIGVLVDNVHPLITVLPSPAHTSSPLMRIPSLTAHRPADYTTIVLTWLLFIPAAVHALRPPLMRQLVVEDSTLVDAGSPPADPAGRWTT